MTSFCHGPLAIGRKTTVKEAVSLEEIRKVVEKYQESDGEDKELLIRITELSARYLVDEASTSKLIVMLNEESAKAR